jgi:hypothetical protein
MLPLQLLLCTHPLLHAAGARLVALTKDVQQCSDAVQQCLMPPLEYAATHDASLACRFETEEAGLAALKCLINFDARPEQRDANKNAYRLIRTKLEDVRGSLRKLAWEVQLASLTLIKNIASDCEANPAFYARFSPVFEVAHDEILTCLMSDTTKPMDLYDRVVRKALPTRLAAYKLNPPNLRLFSEAPSLSVYALTLHVSVFFRLQLQLWDGTHGLRGLRTRAIFAALGCDMNANVSTTGTPTFYTLGDVVSTKPFLKMS